MKRTELKRLAIIKAAKQEFLAHGFMAANMNNVCTQAEISKRTLYRHFTSKERLFKQVLLEIQQESIGLNEYQFDPSTPINEQLYQITLQEAKHLYQLYGIALSRVLVMEFFRQPELAKSVSSELSRRVVLTAWFEQALAAGRLEGQSAEAICSVYLSLFQGLLFWPQVLELAPEPNEAEINAKASLITHSVVRAFLP